MAIKLLINAIAGGGKTSTLETLGEETFVVSRDAKEFALPIPHMLVDTYYNMDVLLYGMDTDEGRIDGITDKLEAYEAHFGKYPENVVIDSVSQIFMDVIDVAAQTPNVYGSQGAEVTKEMAKLTKFIHEYLELNGVNVILLNHVIEEVVEGNSTGNYISFGSGKFLSKGGFYSTTNESLTIVPRGENREVFLRGTSKQARTANNNFPDKMWIANTVNPDKSKKLKEGEVYFTLRDHLNTLMETQADVKKWSF